MMPEDSSGAGDHSEEHTSGALEEQKKRMSMKTNAMSDDASDDEDVDTIETTESVAENNAEAKDPAPTMEPPKTQATAPADVAETAKK